MNQRQEPKILICAPLWGKYLPHWDRIECLDSLWDFRQKVKENSYDLIVAELQFPPKQWEYDFKCLRDNPTRKILWAERPEEGMTQRFKKAHGFDDILSYDEFGTIAGLIKNPRAQIKKDGGILLIDFHLINKPCFDLFNENIYSKIPERAGISPEMIKYVRPIGRPVNGERSEPELELASGKYKLVIDMNALERTSGLAAFYLGDCLNLPEIPRVLDFARMTDLGGYTPAMDDVLDSISSFIKRNK